MDFKWSPNGRSIRYLGLEESPSSRVHQNQATYGNLDSRTSNIFQLGCDVSAAKAMQKQWDFLCPKLD